MSERRGTKALETWCRRMSDGYPGVKVDNMTTSWRDGLAFCAIIHHFRPDLIDFTKLNKDNVYYNNNLAFRLAERHLGIPALLDAEDMVEYEVPDRLSILTYLSQFYQVLAPQGSPTRIGAKRPAVSTDRGIVTSTSSSPPTKMAVRPAGTAGSALGRREPCAKCALPVFLAERLNVGTKLYHRTCFRCARCNNQLSLANCYETEDGQYCCETCPDEEETSAKLPKLDDHKFDSSTSHNFDAIDNFSAKLAKIESSKLSKIDSSKLSKIDSSKLSKIDSSKLSKIDSLKAPSVKSSVVNQLQFDSSNDKSFDSSKKFDSFDLKQQRLDQVRNRSLSDEEKTKGLQQCEDDEYSASFEHALEEKVYEDDSLLSKARTSFLTSHLINEDHIFDTTDINDTSNLQTVTNEDKTTTKIVKLIESYDEIVENSFPIKESATFIKLPLHGTIKLSNDTPPPLPSTKPPDLASLTTESLSSASPLEPCVNKQLNTNQQTISDETTNLRMKNATKDDTNRSSLVKSRMLMFEEQTSDSSASLENKTSIVSKYFSNSKKADYIVPLNKPENILNISDNVNNSTKLAEDVSHELDDSLELLTTFKKENIGRAILTKGDSASMSLVLPPNKRQANPVLSVGDKGILLPFPSGTPQTVEESKIGPVISVGDTGIMLPLTFGSSQLTNYKNEEQPGIPLLPTSGRTHISMPSKVTVLNRAETGVMLPGTSGSQLSEDEIILNPIKEIESYLIAEETELCKVYKAIEELGSSIMEEETEVSRITEIENTEAQNIEDLQELGAFTMGEETEVLQNIEDLHGSSIMGGDTKVSKITEIENTGTQTIEETTIKKIEDPHIPELEFPESILKFVESVTSELQIEETNIDSTSELTIEDIIIHDTMPGLIEEIQVSSQSGFVEEVSSTTVKEETKPTPTKRCLLDISLKQLSSEKLEEMSSANESHNFDTSDETNKLNDSDIKRKLNSDSLVIESNLEENSSPKIQPRVKLLNKSILDNLSDQSPVSIDASLLNSTKSDLYPEDLNPFGDDEDPIPGTKDLGVQKLIKPSMEDLRLLSPTPIPRRKKSEYRKSSNPFDSDEDEVLTKPPLPKKPDVAKKLLEAPKINLNPFWSDDEHSEDDTPKPVPLPRTKPLGTPEPKPRRSELSKNSEKYHSNSSLSSLNSSFGGPSRKKKPAPLPPSNLSLSPQSSKQASPCSSTQQSPRLTPKFRKTRKAPLPPTSTPVNNRGTITSTNLSPIRGQPDIGTPTNCQLGDTQYFTPIGSVDFENEKICKDEKNRNRQSQMIPSPVSDTEDVSLSTASAVDKSMFGKWKRKKGPAPARPVPQRRQIKPLPLMELRRELDIIEMQQQGLEKQGVKLEQLIREKCEGPDATDDTVLSIEVEDMVLELFELVNEKNELFRKQAELMYLRRQQRLEEEYADLEYQIRCLMDRPEQNKTDTDKAREEELISRLVEVVERRNEIVECLEMDRVREAEEDHSINSRLNSLASKRDEENTLASLDTPVKLSKKEKKKMKKDKKMKKKGENLDVDKDIDESETSEPTAEKKKKKKKWFSH